MGVKSKIEGVKQQNTHHYPSVEVVCVVVQFVDRTPINGEDGPNHISEDEDQCSSDNLKVERSRPGRLWVPVQEPMGERGILRGNVSG